MLHLVLSERNVRALLAKLSGYPDLSARTIIKSAEDGSRVAVTIAPDSEVYANRQPGGMHPATEQAIAHKEKP